MSGANASPIGRSHQEMTRRFFAVLILIALAMPVAAQTKATWTPPKTPWGDPDLQGQWPAVANIPMQRPASFGTRAFLTDEELTQREQQAQRQQESDNEVLAKNSQSVTINPPSYWQERQKPNRQASLVVDPPDGRISGLRASSGEFVRPEDPPPAMPDGSASGAPANTRVD